MEWTSLPFRFPREKFMELLTREGMMEVSTFSQEDNHKQLVEGTQYVAQFDTTGFGEASKSSACARNTT